MRSSSSEAAPGLSILFPSIRIGAPDTWSSVNKPWGVEQKERGVSLSEPYTTQLNGDLHLFIYTIDWEVFYVRGGNGGYSG